MKTLKRRVWGQWGEKPIGCGKRALKLPPRVGMGFAIRRTGRLRSRDDDGDGLSNMEEYAVGTDVMNRRCMQCGAG